MSDLARAVGAGLVLAGLCVAVIVGTYVTVVDVAGVSSQDLWRFCRQANAYAAIPAAIAVCYRLAFMAMDRARWKDKRARHLLLWFAYITVGLVVVSRGSAFLISVDASASPWEGARLVLTLMAIALSVWWPHPRPLTYLEEAPRGP